MEWLKVRNGEGSVRIVDIPVLDYTDFFNDMCMKLSREEYHPGEYFAVMSDNRLVFYCLMLDDDNSCVEIASHRYDYYADSGLESLTAKFPAMHVFEREIAEKFGVRFRNNPWDKPLRYPFDRYRKSNTIDNYPFYTFNGESLHEVTVGPIHAGIIKPGAFRFICNGEKVLNLEIALGYQHRGVEKLMTGSANRLRQALLSEEIAGDSAVAHSLAFSYLTEAASVSGIYSQSLEYERAIALEMERIAMHIADTGALCADIGYQLGQVACEALRTIVINTMQTWCGNRFGKGLIRPHGTNYRISEDTAGTIQRYVKEVVRRYTIVRNDLKSMPSLLARFEDCGIVKKEVLRRIGAVGMAARSGGLSRDVRASHPYGVYTEHISHTPQTKNWGDVMARMLLRGKEIFQSAGYINSLTESILANESASASPFPDYNSEFKPSTLSFAFVEGWRGEICHAALTDEKGLLTEYKIKDPSLHNWMALAMAVKGEGISDFPICNKSFNLSYCGHDL